MTSITLKAPAKLNLFLKIVKKRRDGFHDLLTLFERIHLFDRITIKKQEEAGGITVTSDKFITRRQSDNLAFKAARSILEYCGLSAGVRIHIEKNIPVGAGLGGGSSDAASVLKGMNELFKLKVSKAEMMRLGAALGSDVGFFLFDKPFAVGRGKGDRLRALRWNRVLWHLLIYPNIVLSTKDIYTAYDLALTKSPSNVTIMSFGRHCSRISGLIAMLHNDLQQSVIEKQRTVGSIIRRLASSCGCKAVISGSGPSVFCLLKNRKEAVRVRNAFARCLPVRHRKAWQMFVVRTT